MLISRDSHKCNTAGLRRPPRIVAAALSIAAVATVTIALVGCSTAPASPAPAPSPTWSDVVEVPKDAQAFETLSAVAPGAAKLAPASRVQGTQCWTPSEHLFRDPTVAAPSVFRVICRVHYELADAARYTDVVCIGDFDKQPMLDSCYIWKPHLGQPTFDDGTALASPPPTPLP